MGRSLEELRMFLTAEGKRSADNGIKPIERVPLKIVLPPRQLHYVQLCPFAERAGRDPQARRYFVSGCLPEVRSKRTKARKPSGSAQGVEPERIRQGPQNRP